MRLRRFARFSFFLAAGFTLAGGLAVHADEDLPALRTLPCATACANSTGAVGIRQPFPVYPREFIDAPGAYVEGYVRLHYKINPDGHVSDIATVAVVGPQKFADRTVEAVKGWVYKPAMLDGKAVATCRTMVMTFSMPDERPGGRQAIVIAYKAAIQDIKDGKWDEASSVLSEAQAQPKLNLYERGMMGNLASLIALRNGDYLEAHRLSELADGFTGKDLPVAVKQSLLETRTKSALLIGDMVDALESEDRLKGLKGFDPSASIAKMVEEARLNADNLPAFGLTGKIPNASDSEGYFFDLYRRNFGFQDVKGSLDRFTLSCKQQAVESKITDTAEWHVPQSWSDCHLFVYGTPGTTFKVLEAKS